MKTFLAIYLGSPNGAARTEWDNLREEDRQKRVEAGMKAWHAWGEKHQANIVANGTPLGKTKRASKSGIADTKNEMAAYTIVKAESHEAAAQMFKNHPHFAIFPGESVEIMECLPIPGQG